MHANVLLSTATSQDRSLRLYRGLERGASGAAGARQHPASRPDPILNAYTSHSCIKSLLTSPRAEDNECI